jgi:hypothetical protein
VNGAHALATTNPSENGSSSSSEARASQLQQIRTKTTFRNGRTLVNTGVGFVLGNLFFTVSHNLDPGYRVKHYNTQSYLAGVPVDAIAVDTTNDLAIIRIPAALCATWCNSLTVPDASSIGLQQKVEWLDEGVPPIGWQQAKVLSITRPQVTRADSPTNTDCQSGLVVEITQPFPPGTSGTAVWDTQTHKLLGMAQGSYERANGKTSGYFKPLACIIEQLQTYGLSN